MAKKKQAKTVKGPEVLPEELDRQVPLDTEPDPPMAAEAGSSRQAAKDPEEPKKDSGVIKLVLVGALLLMTVALAYYYLILPQNAFMPGTPVDEETFKNLFLESEKVYILMDIRAVGPSQIGDNVMQCGIDFASSSGLGSKDVTPLAIGSEGCVSPNGPTPLADCLSMTKDGLTIYVRDGDGTAQYYNNGMVVTVGKDYTLGTCGIKLL